KAVGVALAAHLAVGDDVDARALHVADGDQRRVILRLLQILVFHFPNFRGSNPRNLSPGRCGLDQEGGRRLAADDGGLENNLKTLRWSDVLGARSPASPRLRRERAAARRVPSRCEPL